MTRPALLAAIAVAVAACGKADRTGSARDAAVRGAAAEAAVVKSGDAEPEDPGDEAPAGAAPEFGEGDAGPDSPVVPDLFSCPTERTIGDLPDDEPGYQLKIMYLLPSDGADGALDTSGSICRSVHSVLRWMAGQTGGPRFRVDTAGGVLDVGFARLDRSDAQLRGSGGTTVADGDAYLRNRLEMALDRQAALAPHKLYVAYYGGSSTYSCGGGAWPPTVPGHLAALYLQGLPAGPIPCSGNPVGASAEHPGYLDYSFLHETMHSLGIVSITAPNQHAAGHVYDAVVQPAQAARDLMYSQRTAGDPPWGTYDPRGLILDVNHDDYYGHGRPDAVDLARSAFMTPTPVDAQTPAGWENPKLFPN
jgi:hypothetical protein